MESYFPSESSAVFPLPTKYKEKISTLPKHHGWRVNADFYRYQGFWCYSFFLEGIMKSQQHFQAQSGDIILSSAPKTGTTWLKALTFAIVTRHHFDDSTNPLLTTVPHECVPLLEVDAVEDAFHRSPKLPLLATHLPYTSLPNSIMSSHCKIVYICREPKDAFISLWHFICKLAPQEEEHVPLEAALDMFCKGISQYGPYWDHVLGYWKASLECPERVLFLKYEDLKSDTLHYIKTLANFMGCPFSLEEESEGVVQKIMNLCSFETLSNLKVNKTGMHRSTTPLATKNDVYFRKGNVGDWKNHLTDEMVHRVDQITEQKFSGTGLMFLQP